MFFMRGSYFLKCVRVSLLSCFPCDLDIYASGRHTGEACRQAGKHAGRQAYREGRQTDRQAGGQAGRQGMHAGRQQTVRKADRQATNHTKK